jgi:hypothetical protein
LESENMVRTNHLDTIYKVIGRKKGKKLKSEHYIKGIKQHKKKYPKLELELLMIRINIPRLKFSMEK